MKKTLLSLIFVVTLGLVGLSGCEAWKRTVKDVGSSVHGLNRTVEVYSQDGKLIKKYEGRLDIEVNEYGNKVKFELNGKRIIINNAIVITEEK